MSLSLLAGIGAIAAALGPSIKANKKFDEELEYKGINNVPLSDIERRVGVKRDKYNMYTYTDMKKLLQYGREHSFNNKEYKQFENKINFVMNNQRQRKAEKYQKEGYASLSDNAKKFIENKGGFNPSDIVEIIAIRRSFAPSKQHQMINDLMNKTWWGKCAVSKPRIKDNLEENVELWKMHVPLTYVNTSGNNYQRKMKKGYKRCLKECGHNPLY